MPFQPGACLETVVTTEIIGDDVEVSRWIVGLNVGKPRDVALGVARGSTPGQCLAIAHTQRSIDPGFRGTTTVIHERFDAVPIGRPAGRWREGAGNYWPEFVGADGRRPLGRLRVVADDRCPFGTNSGSELVPQLWV